VSEPQERIIEPGGGIRHYWRDLWQYRTHLLAGLLALRAPGGADLSGWFLVFQKDGTKLRGCDIMQTRSRKAAKKVTTSTS
jgi:hypothetical protein